MQEQKRRLSIEKRGKILFPAILFVMSDLVTEKVIGAAIEVHRQLEPGLLESTYEKCLAKEFDLRSIRYERQKVGTEPSFLLLQKKLLLCATSFFLCGSGATG